MNVEPMQEIQDYILNIGVKNNSTRSELMNDFQILFNEKTEQLVKWLFEVLAPKVRLEAQKLERDQKPSKSGSSPGGIDLLQEFEDLVEEDNRRPRKFEGRRDY